MKMKELGIFWVADRGGFGGGQVPPKTLGGHGRQGGDPPIPPVGKTLWKSTEKH